MAWIESHQETGRHPKTKKLARRLGVSLPAAVGHLHYLWWWALDFAQDGSLDKFEDEDIADAMHWDGDAAQLVEALFFSGHIDETEHGLVIHDWMDYAGKLLERREKDRLRKREDAEKKKKTRKTKRAPRSSDGNDTESDGNLNASGVTVPNSTVPNSTVPNSTVPNIQTDEAHALQERRFTEFWQAYPKKVGKASCLRAWTKLNPNAELFDQIMAALEAQKNSDQWKREAGRYIPNPLTWINQGRWDDEPVEPAGVPAQPSGTSGMMNKLREMYAAEGGDDE
jgi:hypothetical protein